QQLFTNTDAELLERFVSSVSVDKEVRFLDF
ncbi:MAG: hypothetical protein ACI9SG_002036, partial [Maribacter sp.]